MFAFTLNGNKRFTRGDLMAFVSKKEEIIKSEINNKKWCKILSNRNLFDPISPVNLLICIDR